MGLVQIVLANLQLTGEEQSRAVRGFETES